MSNRGILDRLARIIGDAIEDGADGIALSPLLERLAVVDPVEAAQGLVAELRRKRPRDNMIDGYRFLFEQTLSALVMNINGGMPGGQKALERVRAEIAGLFVDDDLPPDLMMMIANSFAGAGLDPGPALQEAMIAALEVSGAAFAGSGESLDKQFAGIAESLDHDPFAIHGEFSSLLAAFPPDRRGALVEGLGDVDLASAREALVGFLLDPNESIAIATAKILGGVKAGRLVPAVILDRIVRLRPWVGASRQAAIDPLLKAIRPAAAPPRAAPRTEIRGCLASLPDGSGAVSLFVVAKRGRRHLLASVLAREGRGVLEAWVREDDTRDQVDELVAHIVAEVDGSEVSLDWVERALAAALADNLADSRPPPFGLVQVAELLNLPPIGPAPFSLAERIEDLLAGLPPERIGPTAVASAHQASRDWPEDYEVLRSWFNQGDEIVAALSAVKGVKRRRETVMSVLLPASRAFWAGRCALTASILREGARPDDDSWIDWALVGRDLAGDRPLSEIPLARMIADMTIEVFSWHRSAA